MPNNQQFCVIAHCNKPRIQGNLICKECFNSNYDNSALSIQIDAQVYEMNELIRNDFIFAELETRTQSEKVNMRICRGTGCNEPLQPLHTMCLSHYHKYTNQR